MGKFYESIPPELVPWMLKQEMFWVATAPLSPEAHVNVSPKGVRDSFHYVSPTRVWYQDLTGSGVETISHLRENGRITLMFNAFEGPPRIVRLFGIGTFAPSLSRLGICHNVEHPSACGQALYMSSGRGSTKSSFPPRNVVQARAPPSSSTCIKSAR